MFHLLHPLIPLIKMHSGSNSSLWVYGMTEEWDDRLFLLLCYNSFLVCLFSQVGVLSPSTDVLRLHHHHEVSQWMPSVCTA